MIIYQVLSNTIGKLVQADINKIKKDMKWKPKIKLEQGLKDLIKDKLKK